jgi:hypothetical protein
MSNVAPGTGNAFNGRYNPGFGDKLGAAMGNLFLKYNITENVAIETFTTLEQAKGRSMVEKNERTANQFAQDLIIRFGANENFFIGGRYNTLKADVAAATPYQIDINRVAVSAGWYMSKNIMAKIEYVNQKYNGFQTSSIFNNGEFHGLSAQAAIAF